MTLPITTYIVIDRENLRFVAAGPYEAMGAYLEDNHADMPAIVAPVHDARTYSVFEAEQLRQLYFNSTGQELQGTEYSELVKACRDYALTLPVIAAPPQNRLTPPQNRPTPSNSPKRVAEQGGKTNERQKAATTTQYKRPKAGTITVRVWEIADELRKQHPDIPVSELRAKVLELGQKEGINPATVATQFGRWKKVEM